MIRAAGGVVWRPGAAGGREVCLVHRPKYDDWTLPKGKLRPGEPALAAAVREVAEETAVVAVPEVRLPSARYQAGGRAKVVEYWGMRAVDTPPFSPNSEVDRIAWVPEAEAADRVSYPHDAWLLRQWGALPALTGIVLLVRHCEAVPREQWRGADAARPLTAAGAETAEELCRLLECCRPARLVSASPRRCRQTLEVLSAARGLPVEVDLAFNAAAEPDAAADRVRWYARGGATTVVCSQGEVIPGVLARLTGTAPEPWLTAKGDGWLLPFSGAAPLSPTPLA